MTKADKITNSHKHKWVLAIFDKTYFMAIWLCDCGESKEVEYEDKY